MTKKLISIIIPVFNEQHNLPVLYQALRTVLQDCAHTYEYELIFVDDGSTDGSWAVLSALAEQDPYVSCIKFSRNFGHQIALMAGYDGAQGDAVITIDADMQHPPFLIKDMIKAWQEGSKIVYARKAERTDSFLKRTTAHWFYALLACVSEVPMPRHVSDYRLIDRQVLSVLKDSHEKDPYWRGLVAWTGFHHTFIDFTPQQRLHGTTGYTWKKMFKLAFDGIIGFSMVPLKLAAYVGILVIVSGCAMFAYITIDALFFKTYYPLFKWLVTIIYIFMGVQFLLLWILGEYIGRIYEQQKSRPQYVVTERLNDKD